MFPGALLTGLLAVLVLEPAPPLLPGFEPEPPGLPEFEEADEVLQAGPIRPGGLALPPTGELRGTGTPDPVPRAERPRVAAITILFLVALAGLAYLGSHPQVVALEQRVGISELVAAGLPFLLLGAAARASGLVDDTVLLDLSPLLTLGLSWVGFVVGFRFDVRVLDGLPPGTATYMFLSTAVPFVGIVLASALVLLGASGITAETFTDREFLRDALILGTAGALTARASLASVAPGPLDELQRVAWLEQVVGMFGLLVLAAYFRPQMPGLGWQMPGTAWLLLAVGLGAVAGVLAHSVLRRQRSTAESTLLLLGSISFAGGMASYLFLSPIVVCFVAGVLLINAPGAFRDAVRETLLRLERPIYLLFLVVAGALWDAADPRGWVLMIVFVGVRLAGRLVGIRLAATSVGAQAPGPVVLGAALTPMGPLAIAIVVNAQTLFPGGSVPFIVTAVVGGAFLTEILVRVFQRRAARVGP